MPEQPKKRNTILDMEGSNDMSDQAMCFHSKDVHQKSVSTEDEKEGKKGSVKSTPTPTPKAVPKTAPVQRRPGVEFVSSSSSNNDKIANKMRRSTGSSSATSVSKPGAVHVKAAAVDERIQSKLQSSSRVRRVSQLDERIARKQKEAGEVSSSSKTTSGTTVRSSSTASSSPRLDNSEQISRSSTRASGRSSNHSSAASSTLSSSSQGEAEEVVRSRRRRSNETSSSRHRRSNTGAKNPDSTKDDSSEYEKRIAAKTKKMKASSSALKASGVSVTRDYEKRVAAKAKKMTQSSSSVTSSTIPPKDSSVVSTSSSPKPGTFDRLSNLDDRIARKNMSVTSTTSRSHSSRPSQLGLGSVITMNEDDNALLIAHENSLHKEMKSNVPNDTKKKSTKKTSTSSTTSPSLIPTNTLNPDLHAAAMIGAVQSRNRDSDYNNRIRQKQGWVADRIFDPKTRISHSENADENRNNNERNENSSTSSDKFQDEPVVQSDEKKNVSFVHDGDKKEMEINGPGTGTAVLSAAETSSGVKYQHVQEQSQPGAFNISRRAFRHIPSIFSRQTTNNSKGNGFLSFRSNKSKKGFGSIPTIDADVELQKPETFLGNHHEDRIYKKCCRDKSNFMVGLLLLSLIVGAITTPLILSNNNKKEDSNEADEPVVTIDTSMIVPTFSPTHQHFRSSVFEHMLDILEPISPRKVLTDDSLPQGKAIKFLAYQDSLREFSSDKILPGGENYDEFVQRYALLVFFFQYGDIFSDQPFIRDVSVLMPLLASKHVCDWSIHVIRCKTIFAANGQEVDSFDMGTDESSNPKDFHKGKRFLNLNNASNRSTNTTSSPIEIITGNIVERQIVTGLTVIKKSELMNGHILISEIGLLSSLELLDLSNNLLSGPLPKELFELEHLRDLVLSNNRLSNEIDERIGSLTNLRLLSLERCKLIGSIPRSLQDLTNLNYLVLHGNKVLTGDLLDMLIPLKELVKVDAAGSDFSGTIPSEIGTLTNLKTLIIGNNNKLHGTIPSEIGNLTDMRQFIISNTKINGSIPSEIGNCQNLVYFRSENCFISGSIPTTLGNLSNLRVITLQNNALKGKIPNDLGNLASLENLNLFHNELSGDLPYTFGQMKKLKELRLQGNDLTGSIHENVCYLRENEKLQVLEADQLLCCDKSSCCTSGCP